MHQLIDMTPNMIVFEADSGLTQTQSQSGNGGSGGGGVMLGRATKLEEQVTSLVVDVAVIKSNYATKENIAKLAGMIGGTKTDYHRSTEGEKTELHRSIDGVKTERQIQLGAIELFSMRNVYSAKGNMPKYKLSMVV